ncbi:hypothetical protein LVJ94_46795 [Pendulispora rubella]|uniref:AsmA-like C-terminal domain-containing protein n=1 Tax=Pendulispora rubella TaxID=2741070 RepID=A0ABZ2L0Q9_9BACT
MRRSVPVAHESPDRTRRWRLIRRVLVALGALVGLMLAATMGLAHSLDHPWVKARVRTLVLAKAGLDIDYAAVRLQVLKGIAIDGFVLRSPPALRDVAPELARVGRIEAGWSTSLFTGQGRRVDRVALSDAVLTVALDEHGSTSFDALFPSDPAAPPKKATPLSHRGRDVEALLPALPDADVSGFSFVLVRTVQGKAVDRTTLRGVGLHARPESEGGWRLRANMGGATAPLELDVAREQEGTAAGDAHGRLWLTADLTPSELAAVVDVEVPSQTFVPGLRAGHALHAEATARFDPAAGKTDIALAHASAAGGSTTAEAALELPDEGAPFVRHAQGDVDVAKLLAIVPSDLLGVRPQLGRGQLHYRVDRLATHALPRLNDGAEIALEAELADAKLAQTGTDVDVGAAKLSAHVVPAADASIHVKASLAIDRAKVMAGSSGVRAKDVALDVEATQAKDGALTGRAGFTFADGSVESLGAPLLAAAGGNLGLRVENLEVNPAAPLASRGEVTATSEMASLGLRSAGMRTTLERVAFRAESSLAGHAPYTLQADARAASLRVEKEGQTLARAPVHIAARLEGAAPDLERPAASRGIAHVTADLGEVHTQLDATKSQDALEFSLESNAPSLEMVRPFVPAEVAKKTPWEHMALALRSRGRVQHIASTAPAIEQHTEIDLARPAFERIAARSAKLVLDSKGTLLHPTLDADMRFERLTLDGANASDDHLSVAATLDREAPSLNLKVATEGRAQAKLGAALAFDRARRAVTYDVTANVGRLSSLAALASVAAGWKGVDLSKLELALAARGTLGGVVSDVDRNGTLRLERTPMQTATLDGTIDVRGKHIAWSGGDAEFSTAEIALAAKVRSQGARRTVEGRIEADELHVASGRHDYVVAGLRDELTASVEGDLAEPNLEIIQQMSLRALKQDIAPMYPVGDATLSLTARRNRDGVIRVPKLDITNGTGGTTLSLRGAFDPSESQRRLSLRGTLRQDLARMSTMPAMLSASGTASAEFRVQSPNLSTFRVIADTKVEGASLRMPRSGVVVEGADGEVPITLALRVNEKGVRMLREDQDNRYSSLRFSDQHPLLSRGSFISIRRLTLPQVTIAPLVGNLQIEQNIISLRQFEMGIRGGHVTGLCALDWNGENSTLNMHVRADGVKSSRGEPFSGNAALEISAGEHSIAGRADILQIGNRHFLDLLELQDPFHADPSINRIRSALSLGYPDRLRVTFNHGFASVHVTFGGLARLVSVGDIRGIPMGPLIDRYLAPVVFPMKKEP